MNVISRIVLTILAFVAYVTLLFLLPLLEPQIGEQFPKVLGIFVILAYVKIALMLFDPA